MRQIYWLLVVKMVVWGGERGRTLVFLKRELRSEAQRKTVKGRVQSLHSIPTESTVNMRA